MMDIRQRLQRLEGQIGVLPPATVFSLEGGGGFRAECDPLSYLLQHGTETPRGRIVGIELPAGENDPITVSLYETIDRMIKEPGG